MQVKYLDLKTGKTQWDAGIGITDLEGNWSCDCNRALAFAIPHGDTCIGCKRFIVVDVMPEAGDGYFDKEQVIRTANYEYFVLLGAGNLK